MKGFRSILSRSVPLERLSISLSQQSNRAPFTFRLEVMLHLRFLLTAVMFVAVTAVARGEIVTLEPIKDNTLYETGTEALSNGAGPTVFAGRTGQGAGQSIRRALLAFDIFGNIPPGSTIGNVTLTLHMSKTISGAQTMSLQRVLTDWGEGTSNAGNGNQPETGGGGGALAATDDATWIHTFFDTSVWTSPGGDFSGTISASQEGAGFGSYTWGPTADMRADVQSWLDQPGSNFGWILIGDEASRVTAKRFDSRESSVSVRPLLTVDFTTGGATPTPTPTPPPGTCVGDCGDDGQVTISDLIRGVNITLGLLPVSNCPAFANMQGMVTIAELIRGVNNTLNGCPA